MDSKAYRLKDPHEIGDMPFRVIEMEEKILQGWSGQKKKKVYLFKGNSGNWSYYSTSQKQVVGVNQWQDESALIEGVWVKMGIYFRIHVLFLNALTVTTYEKGGSSHGTVLRDASIVVTEKAYNALQEQMRGRVPESYYRFIWKKLKKGSYVDDVTFVQ